MSVSFESVYRKDAVAEPSGMILRRLSEEMLTPHTAQMLCESLIQ